MSEQRPDVGGRLRHVLEYQVDGFFLGVRAILVRSVYKGAEQDLSDAVSAEIQESKTM